MSDTRGRGSAPTLDLRSAASVQTRSGPSVLDQVLAATGSGFDAEAWHVMNERDNAMIANELLNGSGSSKFVYSFSNKGEVTSGTSVIGARHLAAYYGGITHRLIGSIEKRGALFVFISYSGGMTVETKLIRDLEEEMDYYTCLVEMEDVKTGNRIQLEKTENRQEKKRDGSGYFDRGHFKTIAQSKAYRNGVLALIPQDIRIKWEMQQLALAKGDVITGSVIEEKRAGILRYAAGKGIAVDRRQIEALTLDQIAGLSDAAREKDDGLFMRASRALGLIEAEIVNPETGEVTGGAPVAKAAEKPAERQQRAPRQLPAKQAEQAPPPAQEPQQAQQAQEPPLDPDEDRRGPPPGDEEGSWA